MNLSSVMPSFMDDFNNFAMTKLPTRVFLHLSTLRITTRSMVLKKRSIILGGKIVAKVFNLLSECFARYVNCRAVLYMATE